jgi:hypothetical protein
LATAIPVAAQGTGAVIAGTIKDAQGGVLPGVSLTVRNVDTGVTRTVVPAGDGTYRFGGLPPGDYDLTAELPGFAPAAQKGLTLTINLELRRDVTMALQGVQESLTVTGGLRRRNHENRRGRVVTREQIDSLPIANRQPPLSRSSYRAPPWTRRRCAVAGVYRRRRVSNVNNMYLRRRRAEHDHNSGQQFLEVWSAIREFRINMNQASAQ